MAEDYFDARPKHTCFVEPTDGSPSLRVWCNPYQVAEHLVGDAEDVLMMITLSTPPPPAPGADLAPGDESETATMTDFTPVDGADRRQPRQADYPYGIEEKHCVQPWTGDGLSGNSCTAKTILAIRLAFSDTSPTYCTEACVQRELWNDVDSSGTRIDNDALFRASSYGQAHFDESGSAIVTVTVNQSVTDFSPGHEGALPATGCAYYTLKDLAVAGALALGYDAASYNHVQIFQPVDASLACGYGGLGNVRGRHTWIRSGCGDLSSCSFALLSFTSAVTAVQDRRVPHRGARCRVVLIEIGSCCVQIGAPGTPG